ncbi:MAG: nitronate monooxygenase [Lachnospiraceae bacterium]|nr:nitronate monooxygenase [Lachnospiraceae bacterium]
MKIGKKILKVPIIQGGMGIGVSLSGLAGAVAACGAMGVISSVNIGYRKSNFYSNPREANLTSLKEEIIKAKEKSGDNGMVAVNIMTAVSNYGETCKAAVSAGADAIISGAGLPIKLPEYTKGTDTLCIPIVSGGRAAKLLATSYMKKYGVLPDMFIIEGNKAGGHLGFSKEDLLSGTAKSNDEILKEVLSVTEELEKQYGKKIPVAVAGGVFDGADMAHFLKEGAMAVQIGTRFIATDECDANERFKQAIVNAKEEDVKIVESPVGMPARAIISPLIKRLENGDVFRAIKCNGCLTACKKDESIPYCISRALIEAVKGNWEEGLFFAGSNAFRISKIVSVKELINEILSECETRLKERLV